MHEQIAYRSRDFKSVNKTDVAECELLVVTYGVDAYLFATEHRHVEEPTCNRKELTQYIKEARLSPRDQRDALYRLKCCPSVVQTRCHLNGT